MAPMIIKHAFQEENMNRQFVVSVIVLSVMSLLGGFVVHAVLLAPDYAALPLYRSTEDGGAHFPYMLLAHLMIGTGFVWIYRRGREAGDWLGQGLRFGMAVVVLMTVPMYLIYFAVQPLPAMLVVKQIAFDAVAILLMGIVVAWLHRAS
jgi:hypothetical protein